MAAQLEVRGLPISADILAKMEQGKYSIRLSVLKALKEIYKAGSYDDFFQGMYPPTPGEGGLSVYYI